MSSTVKFNQRRAFIQAVSKIGGVAVAVAIPFSSACAGQATLRGFKLASQDNLELYFDLDRKPAGHNIFTLSNPDRLVIDLMDVKMSAQMKVGGIHSSVVKDIRYATHDKEKLRIVVDLKRAIKHSYKFINRSGGAKRLIVDMGVQVANVGGKKVVKNTENKNTSKLRDIVVAIDAGHGGRDPGAIGTKKTREKDITLAVAKRLSKALAKVEGFKPVLIRDSDKYISLRDRTKIARDHKADLFVSIHADAFRNKQAKGASVYALSLKGASSEAAQWLADKENSVDLFGDVSLDGRTKVLRETLFDLAQNATLESSLSIGDIMLQEMRRFTSLHKASVEMANFAVLKSPDIPSVLVETAFLTNPKEESKLRSAKHQDRLARALRDAIVAYFERVAPPGTVIASKLAGRNKS